MKEFFQKSIYLLLTFLSFFAININVNYFGDDFSYLKWTKAKCRGIFGKSG